MKRIIYTSLVILLSALWTLELSAQYNWTHSGPESLGNRTRSLIYDAQGNLLAGSGGGALWKSTNQGVSWFKLESYKGNPAVTTLARNGNTIYLGTGEIEYYNLAIAGQREYNPASPEGVLEYVGHLGAGVYVSKDNGVTWSNNNATTSQFPTLNNDGPFIGIQKIAFGPQGNRIFIATRDGLYYSDDENLGTVQKSQGSPIFEAATIYDVEVSGDVIFAGTSDSLYISEDRGLNFKVAPVTPRPLSFVRVEIEVAPSNPDVIYVAGSRNSSVSQLNGVWRSNDRGKTWTQFAPQGGPGFSPLGNTARDAFVLRVFPDDENALIIGGNAWFTYNEATGWTQTASHTNPTRDNYIPRPMYCLTFDPEDPDKFFIGTGSKITRSEDRGVTFFRRSAGYASTMTYTVGSVGMVGMESIISGTPIDGTILNNNFWREAYDPTDNPTGPPTLKGYGIVNTENNGLVATSSLYAGSVVIQGSDKGTLRSAGTFGSTFERFYGPPLNSDTLVRPSTGERDSVVAAPLTGISIGSIYIDRSSGDQEPGGMVDNNKTSPQMQFVLDETVPAAYVAPPNVSSIEDLKKYPGKDSLQKLENYLFYASSRYIWICHFPLGSPEGLTPRWDRITNDLNPSGDEYFTAMAVSNDGEHTVYVGTSKGKIWRIKGATNFDTYDGATGGVNVSDIITNATGAVASIKGRWISDIAVDPKDPNRIAVTFAGYGGVKPVSYVWLIQNALTSPQYSFFALAPKEPAYSCEFVEYQPDPNDPATEVSLFIGTESGLYSTRTLSAGGAFVAELPESYGNIPVHDIYARKYRIIETDEETSDYVLQKDNTLFAATRGYGVWYTNDARFTARDGQEEAPGLEINGFASNLFPNPSNTLTTVRVDLTEASQVKVNLFTLDGRKVMTLADGQAEEGRHEYKFDTRSLNPGVYLVEVKAEGATQNNRQTLKAVITR